MAIGTAMAIGLGASALGSVLGAKAQKKAATTAADTSLAVAQQNNALAQNIYNQNQATLSPFVNAGSAATGQINALLGLGGDQAAANSAFNNYRNSTGYQFRLGEGMRGVNSGYAGAGLIQSGAAMRGIQEYGQNFASNEYANYQNLLANQQAVGLSGASALAGVGQNYTNTVSANNNAAGTTAANAALVRGASNPFAQFAGTLGGTILGGGLQF